MKSLLLLCLNEPEGLGLDLAGTDTPEIDRELTGDRDDRFFARGPGWRGRLCLTSGAI